MTMPIYRVIDKSNGRTVYAYSAEAPVEFAEYPFLGFSHLVEAVVRDDGSIATNDPRKLITKRAFWNRFPAANETAMRAVLLVGTPQLLAAGLERLRSRVDASPYVDLLLQETMDGVAWLASAGVPESVTLDGVTVPLRLSAPQAEAILTAPVTQIEAWQG